MNSIIIKNGNVCELDIPLKYAQKLYKKYSVRHPNWFYLRNRRGWDGFIKYITATGQFKIGLLESIVRDLQEIGFTNYKIIDTRKPVPKVDKIVTQIGNYKLRPEQIQAVESIVHHTVKGIPFHIGVLDYTVNAGKSLIMAAIYYSFKKGLKTLLITNDADWLNQAKDEFKQYLPGENITFVQGKVNNWSNFSIGMVQSLSRNIKYYQGELASIDMILVDEADLAGSKQYQNVITRCFNARVRIGLSGTIYMSKMAKDKVKNLNLKTFFGEIISQFHLIESIKKGYSTKTIVKAIQTKPYFGNWESSFIDYKDIYNDTITNNEVAWKIVRDRLLFNLNYGRIPALVVCKFIEHAENLYAYLSKELKNYRIERVHVKTKTKVRNKILKDFREGKIDILISTTIIARGKNFPLLRCLINAASMDSQEKSIQFLGRLVRTHASKSKVYLDDIHYPGNYLDRHGKHRERYYREQKLKVIKVR